MGEVFQMKSKFSTFQVELETPSQRSKTEDGDFKIR